MLAFMAEAGLAATVWFLGRVGQEDLGVWRREEVELSFEPGGLSGGGGESMVGSLG